MKRTFLIAVLILIVATMAFAGDPMHSAKWSRDVKFYESVHAGTVAIPAGDYRVQHEMDGSKHIMVFTRIGKWSEHYRVECTMVTMEQKASSDALAIRPDASGQKNLLSMVFKGEDIRHVFGQ